MHIIALPACELVLVEGDNCMQHAIQTYSSRCRIAAWLEAFQDKLLSITEVALFETSRSYSRRCRRPSTSYVLL